MDMRFQAVGLPAEPETVFHSFLFLYLFLYLTLFDKTSSSIVEWTRTVANRSQEDSQVIEGYRIFSTSSKTRSPKLVQLGDRLYRSVRMNNAFLRCKNRNGSGNTFYLQIHLDQSQLAWTRLESRASSIRVQLFSFPADISKLTTNSEVNIRSINGLRLARRKLRYKFIKNSDGSDGGGIGGSGGGDDGGGDDGGGDDGVGVAAAFKEGKWKESRVAIEQREGKREVDAMINISNLKN
ncbi:hypothetical protein V1478_017339 [Vespula squamosa]|uniref:Uncharacterized protein n=1 Tax=Vespula squamosa TaxID=30214 RepID=A0ABD1ZXQ1_VESSQ